MGREVERRAAFDPQQQIKRVIIEAKLQPGDPMPTEAQLIDRLGISRGSLREALKSLQAKGIVNVVHGRGMFVGSMSMDALVDGLIFHTQLGSHQGSRRTASDLIDIRDILETALIREVVPLADRALLDLLDEIVVGMEDLGPNARPFQELDRQFHSVLYRPLENETAAKLIQAFWDVLDAARPELPPLEDDRQANASHHRAILSCLQAGDAAEAGEAMGRHFRSTHRWIQDEWPDGVGARGRGLPQKA
jgi:DNA-binding FadR family transcriptional regulator